MIRERERERERKKRGGEKRGERGGANKSVPILRAKRRIMKTQMTYSTMQK